MSTVEDLKRMYPNQFDRIGNLPGEAKLLVHQDAEPYIDAPRKWPIHLKDRIKEELVARCHGHRYPIHLLGHVT